MSTDPKQMWEQLQKNMQRVQQAGGRFSGGGAGGAPGPRGALTGIGGLILLGGGVWFFNNALFNGMMDPESSMCLRGAALT
jgi:prohibitin 2